MSFDSLIKRTAPPATYRKLEGYYEGKMRLDALGVSLPPQMRVLEQSAPFPKLSVDVLTEVMVPAGFILGDDNDISDLLRHWWSVNDMGSAFSLAATEALVQGAAYWVIGQGNGNVPRITAHSRNGVATAFDHTGRVCEAVVTYGTKDDTRASYYEPGRTTYYVKRASTYNQWRPIDSVKTGLNVPTIVPMFNRERLEDTRGRSSLLEILTVTDAASRTLTNLQVAQELVSMPQRYLLGDGVTEGLANSAAAKGMTMEQAKFQAYIGNFLLGPKDGAVGQLPGATLDTIINTYKLYAQEVSAITGIPPSMLGISTDNPSSAEAMRVAKDRLIQRAERTSRIFGDALEEVFRIALRMKGIDRDDLDSLELRWRDPATASESARAASLLQAHAQGVISAETAREGLRLTPEQTARERSLSDITTVMNRQMGA